MKHASSSLLLIFNHISLPSYTLLVSNGGCHRNRLASHNRANTDQHIEKSAIQQSRSTNPSRVHSPRWAHTIFCCGCCCYHSQKPLRLKMETAQRLGKVLRHPRGACAISHRNVPRLTQWCILARWTEPWRAWALTCLLCFCVPSMQFATLYCSATGQWAIQSKHWSTLNEPATPLYHMSEILTLP